MTMIPPKIRKLPNLHKPVGYISKPQQGSTHSNKSTPIMAKMVR